MGSFFACCLTIFLFVTNLANLDRPPSDMAHFAKGIKVVSRDCCISEEGGAVPYDARLTCTPVPK